MPFYEKGDFRIYYEEAGSGFPLLLIPGGGLNSTISYFTGNAPFNAIEEFKGEYRCIAVDLRNARDGSPGHPGVHGDGFVFTVTRDFVRACQTPILVPPDDVPAHPYAVAMESVRLAPKAEASLYPWKDSKDHIAQAVCHVRTFLRAHQPVAAAHKDAA